MSLPSQHATAKHRGRHTVLRPAWSAAAGADGVGAHAPLTAPGSNAGGSESEGEEGLACAVCGWCFPTATALAAHMEGWQPVAELRAHACSHCGVGFASERAKKQHENFCEAADS